MSCPCDLPPLPAARAIAYGLPRLPRAIGDFATFRRSLLSGIRDRRALDGWRARDRDDLGVMLLEFWAYVADIVAFYDEVFANEAYLRTAVRAESVSRLIGLLGYQPRPASAASALLAVLADGIDPVTLEVGTAFRSGAFDEEPPQVFETETAASVHPLANRWTVRAPRSETLATGTGVYAASHLDCEPRGLDLAEGALVLVRSPGHAGSVHEVADVVDVTAADGSPQKRVTFASVLDLPASELVRQIEVLKPTQTAGLWVADPFGASEAEIALERAQPGIRPGDTVVVSKDADQRWFTVLANRTASRVVRAQELVQQTVGSETISILIPAVTTLTTLLVLDVALNDEGRRGGQSLWLNTDLEKMIVRFGLVRAARVAAQPKMQIGPDAPLLLQPGPRGTVLMPPDAPAPRRFILADEGGRAYAITGSLDPAAGTFGFEVAADWPEPLVPPVTIYGNVVDINRGESVAGEVLGDGDRAVAGQTFKLKKAPVTHLPDTSGASERGYRSTVTVWVDGVQWTDAIDFVTAGPADPVYVLRQNDDGETEVAFGDGVNGRRLPTGAGNVVVAYRHGAGAAAPPARAITQLARPIKGVASVVNPIAAGGGADAESPDEVRDNAPAAALLIGRVVSLEDVRAVAASYPGIVAAHADWRWHGERQTAVVSVLCISNGTDLGALKGKIRNLAEPSLQLEVAEAVAVPLRLSLSIEIDPTYRQEDVLSAARARLMDDATGLLAPANIGIGQKLFRSRICAAVLAVPGTVAVAELLADEAPFDGTALVPEPGQWFDVGAGGLVINGQDGGDGE